MIRKGLHYGVVQSIPYEEAVQCNHSKAKHLLEHMVNSSVIKHSTELGSSEQSTTLLEVGGQRQSVQLASGSAQFNL